MRYTFEELEEIVETIEEERVAVSNLQNLHLDILLGEHNIFFDTHTQRKQCLNLIEELIDDKIHTIKSMKGVK